MISKVDVPESMHEFIKSEAKRNHRTIKGQTAYMLELAMSNYDGVKSGKTQFDPLTVVEK